MSGTLFEFRRQKYHVNFFIRYIVYVTFFDILFFVFFCLDQNSNNLPVF